MPEAGPSRRRSRSPATQHAPYADTPGSKRKRGARASGRFTREDIFARPDPEAQQRLNDEYRELQEKADEMSVNTDNIRVTDLEKLLRRTDDAFADVRDTTMAGMDARLLTTATETASHLLRKMKLGTAAFNVDEFLVRISGRLGLAKREAEDVDDSDDERDERLARARKGALGDWESIGWMAAGLTRRVPGVEFMYGPLAIEHKKRTLPRRQAREKLGEAERPDEVVAPQGGKAAKDPTTSNVRSISKILDQLDPDNEGINYFRLVVNPNDFGQTVENVFYTSFLIREGRVGLDVKDDGEIIIRTTEPPDAELDAEVPLNQAVIELTMADWEEAKRVFNITESAIPHRVPARDQ